jgi:hypothetical protein
MTEVLPQRHDDGEPSGMTGMTTVERLGRPATPLEGEDRGAPF